MRTVHVYSGGFHYQKVLVLDTSKLCEPMIYKSTGGFSSHKKQVAYNKQYRLDHREAIYAIHNAWRAKNKEKCNAYARSYYQRHHEKRLAYLNEWKRKKKEEKCKVSSSP